MDPTVDYYRVLGVPATAGRDAIRAAYRSLIQKYHPDRFAGDATEAERRTSELNVAFGVIGDARTRSRYDRLRANAAGARAAPHSAQRAAPWWRVPLAVSILLILGAIAIVVLRTPSDTATTAAAPALTEPPPPPVQDATPPAPTAAVTAAAQLMPAHYGNQFDTQLGCWRYEASGLRNTHYCMKVAQAQTISAHDGERLYLLADGYPYDPQTMTPNATHDDGGLVGAFLYQRSPFGDWELRAGRANFEFGNAGRSGADRAELRAVGVNDYLAWIFVVGAAGQDTTTRSVAILAPSGRQFANLADK